MKKLFLASIALTTFALSIGLFQMTSCKKAEAQVNNTNTTYPIEGLWIGTYTVDSQPALGEQYFALSIKPDSTIVADTKWGTTQHLAPGSWSLSGNTFTCTYTCVYGLPNHIGIEEKITATWSNTGTLIGTWENSPTPTGSGHVVFHRVN